MQKFHNRPKNWQDFELLCYHLWSAKFKSDNISRNGRQGQNQQGIDIYGNLPDGKGIFGIQCKGKDNFNNSQITEEEINTELQKALNFHPSLSLIIFATTSKRDAKIQEYVRLKSEEYSKSHNLQVDIKFWDCIEEMLEFYNEVGRWYDNGNQQSYSVDVKAIVENGRLEPVFNRVRRTYQVPTKCASSIFFLLTDPPVKSIFDQRPFKNHTWCEFDIEIKNNGCSVLENYSLDIHFEEAEIQAISNMNDKFTNNFWETEINKLKSEKMELFHHESDDFSLIFEPKDKILVQKGKRSCRIGLLPKYTCSELHVKWKLLARDFNDEGLLVIPIIPSFVEKNDTIFVRSFTDERIENVVENGIEYLDGEDDIDL